MAKTPQADPELLAAAEAELAAAQKELAWELSKAAVDAAGIFDPTPISDGVGAAMSLSEGDLIGAGLSLISMVPYLGDAIGKTAKGARALKRINHLRRTIVAATMKVSAVRKAIKAAKARRAAIAKAAAKLANKTGREIAARAKAIMQCPKMAKQLDKATAACGLSKSAAAQLLAIAEKKGLLIRMRPGNIDPQMIKRLERGEVLPKPSQVKMKTIDAVDELLGAPKDRRGLAAVFEPKKPDNFDTLSQNVKERYEKRLDEYTKYKKEFPVEKDGIRRNDDNGLEWGADDIIRNKDGKPFASDNDIFDIRKANGDPLSETERLEVVDMLMQPPVSAQHADHISWNPKDQSEMKEKMSIIERHRRDVPLGEFGPNGFKQELLPR